MGTQLGSPHWPGTPLPPPHDSGGVQVPHWTRLPQPSPAGPHVIPCDAHVIGVQTKPPSDSPHWPGTPPPPHVSGVVQLPQLSDPPQPLPAGPHMMFCEAQVIGVHVGMPHWPGTPPPPHVCGETQVPQLSEPPQPSPAGPHAMFCDAHVSGVQPPPHWFGVPPPPHV